MVERGVGRFPWAGGVGGVFSSWGGGEVSGRDGDGEGVSGRERGREEEVGGTGRDAVQRVRLRLLDVYTSPFAGPHYRHHHIGESICIDYFRRQDRRLELLVRKTWRGVFESLPAGLRWLHVDVGCGAHFERSKVFRVEKVEGRRKRGLQVRVGGCVDRYGLEVLEGCVRRVLRGVGWEEEGGVGGKWVVVEGVGGMRVEELERVSGDGGVEWDSVWNSYSGKGWVEEVW